MVTSISSNSQAAAAFPLLSQSRQDFSSMVDALKSGDVDAAKTAFTSLQQDVEQIQSKIIDAGGTPYFGTRPTDDLQSIKTALDSGDVQDARKAFHTLMQDLRQIRRHHVAAWHHAATTQAPEDPEPTTENSINITA